ncbi:MAG: mechanosensitive ion channel family protein [Anaerolineales bacterium]|jgi:miniconductance mechanosensitive channel
MTMENLQVWMEQNPFLAIGATIGLSVLVFLIARGIIARGLIYLSGRTKTSIDDIIVKNLHPFRVAWLAPLILIYAFADLVPQYQTVIQKTALFLILWMAALVINSLLNALNEIYESRREFTGESIQGYLDIVKILVIMVGVILSVSIVTDESPLVLLTSLGAITAVLLLIFRDTILSLVASIQIGAQDLVKEGDWIEVPEYGADGDVMNISLHSIKVQNFDKTITVIPTYKMVEVAYKNWRGMQESGGRRIKRSIVLDVASLKLLDKDMLERLRNVDLIHDYLEAKIEKIRQFELEQGRPIDSPLDGPQITNIEVFRAYIEAYLRSREDLHHEEMALLVRELSPSPMGLPLEVYVFTKTTDWFAYESIQAEIFDHLLSVAPFFDLRVFQQPTGLDFASLARRGEE